VADTIVIRATFPLPILTLKGTPAVGAAGAAGAGSAAGTAAAEGAGAAGSDTAAEGAGAGASLACLDPPEQDPSAMPSTTTPAGMRKRFFLKNGGG
jgi:hypothetical protein